MYGIDQIVEKMAQFEAVESVGAMPRILNWMLRSLNTLAFPEKSCRQAMERNKVYFKIKGDDCLNVYHTSATCEQESIWQWQASCFAKYYECEFHGVKLALSENNH